MIFLHFCCKLTTYFCTSPILKSPLAQSNYLDKNAKKTFFVVEKIKKYRKCPALGFEYWCLLQHLWLFWQLFFLQLCFFREDTPQLMLVFAQTVMVSRAGHLRYFFIFSIIKNDFFAFFIKLITYFCTSPI